MDGVTAHCKASAYTGQHTKNICMHVSSIQTHVQSVQAVQDNGCLGSSDWYGNGKVKLSLCLTERHDMKS